jgi:hypothetical protein
MSTTEQLRGKFKNNDAIMCPTQEIFDAVISTLDLRLESNLWDVHKENTLILPNFYENSPNGAVYSSILTAKDKNYTLHPHTMVNPVIFSDQNHTIKYTSDQVGLDFKERNLKILEFLNKVTPVTIIDPNAEVPDFRWYGKHIGFKFEPTGFTLHTDRFKVNQSLTVLYNEEVDITKWAYSIISIFTQLN